MNLDIFEVKFEAEKIDHFCPKSEAIALAICPKLVKNEPGYF